MERLKIQLENCAKSISYYNGKNKQYPDKLDIDALCELYKAYSDFFMFGIRKEEKSKDVKYEEITNENMNAAM